METRSKRLKENDEMDDVNDDKCDDVSINSMSSSQLSTSRLKLDKALLKKRNIEKRLELERQLKMLDLQEEVDIAELKCKAIEDDERLPVDKCGINAKVENYLDCDTGCNNHSWNVCNISKIDWVAKLKDTLHTMLASIDDVQDAIQLAKTPGLLLRKGGFRLTKWINNCLQVLESIHPEDRAEAVRKIGYGRLSTERALGLFWNTMVDLFEFKVRIPKRSLTRRGISSSVASLYDPLGLSAPFVLPMNQLLQRLGKFGLGWDEEIPNEESKRWLEILSEFQRVENVSFSRCVLFLQSGHPLLELHIFSDASETGYGAVAYVRSYICDTEVCFRLVTA
ncbi:unnamed protein product [Schistosoma margrebowiei]|uniref:Uncharacterized protein n=1 Tax=Schistosoma margrebowiei TaxID=48269 RepID=A0A183N4H6_9TREM|nr:unnamed protein product [Schistosoma margrebowiei]